MKFSIKALLCLIVVSFSLASASCKKQEKKLRTFYLNSARDSEVIGKYEVVFINSSNGLEHLFVEYTREGKKLNSTVRNGKTYKNITENWYTEGTTIHILTYTSSVFDKSYEKAVDYYLSPLKDTLFTRLQGDNV